MTYDVILADPPWQFETWSAKGKGRSPEQHYSCMSLDDICALPVEQVSSPNAVLFLWVTWPTILDYAPKVLEAWGFSYRSLAWVWVKTNPHGLNRLWSMLAKAAQDKLDMLDLQDYITNRLWFIGTGYYTRANSEPCLIAVKRGGKAPVTDRGVKSVLMAPVTRHSQKPLEQYSRIGRLYPDRPNRLELFARQAQPGWVALGNEVNGGMDIKQALDNLSREGSK